MKRASSLDEEVPGPRPAQTLCSHMSHLQGLLENARELQSRTESIGARLYGCPVAAESDSADEHSLGSGIVDSLDNLENRLRETLCRVHDDVTRIEEALG